MASDLSLCLEFLYSLCLFFLSFVKCLPPFSLLSFSTYWRSVYMYINNEDKNCYLDLFSYIKRKVFFMVVFLLDIIMSINA